MRSIRVINPTNFSPSKTMATSLRSKIGARTSIRSVACTVFNRAVARAPVTGDIHLSIPGARGVRRHVPELELSLDWFGLNHYTRWKVDSLARDPHVVPSGAPRTDLGWEIHPPGFEEALVHAAESDVPVLVTENGFADHADAFRPRALVEYLLAMGAANAAPPKG
jgi:hypothetical protein